MKKFTALAVILIITFIASFAFAPPGHVTRDTGPVIVANQIMAQAPQLTATSGSLTYNAITTSASADGAFAEATPAMTSPYTTNLAAMASATNSSTFMKTTVIGNYYSPTNIGISMSSAAEATTIFSSDLGYSAGIASSSA